MDNQRLINLVNGENQDKKSNYSLLIYVILPLTLAAAVLFYNLDNPFSRRKAQQALDNYIASEYTTELDIFQKQDSLATISEGGLLGNKIVAYSYYFTQPEKGWGGFTISADTDGNVVYDGYKQWYLTGGMTFEHYDEQYRNLAYDIEKALYTDAIENDIATSFDKIDVKYYLTSKQTNNGYGSQMVYPNLDPECNYSLDELAKEYGNVRIYIRTANCSTEDFLEFAKFSRNFINKSNAFFNEIVFCMRPASIKDIRNIHTSLTYEDMYSDNSNEILKDNTTIYTTEQYDKDYRIAGNNLENWPEEYLLDVQMQLTHDRF